MKNTWKSVKAIAKKIANVQADIVLTIVFFIIIVPMGIVMRYFFKKSLLRTAPKSDGMKTYWISRVPSLQTLSEARRQ